MVQKVAIPQITKEQRLNYDYLDCLEKVKQSAQAELDRAERERACSGFACKLYKSVTDGLFQAFSLLDEAERQKRIENGEVDPALFTTAQTILNFFGIATGNPLLTVGSGALVAIEHSPRTEAETTRIVLNESLKELGDVIVSFTNPGHEFLYFTQWMWISTLEMAMFLNGLFAPMFFAVSMIPGKERMVNLFLIEFLTIGLAKMAYMIIIGIVAIQLSTTGTGIIDDTFFMTMGIFAPAVSFAVVTAGGLAAASSYKSQSVGAAAAVGGLVSSGAATVAYSMTRAADKHR